MFKPKLPKPEQGFTIVEVMIAIVIAIIFVAVAMQMMVAAALLKAKAQEYAEATNWIQQDLEEVKYQASKLAIKNVESMTAEDNLTTLLDEADLITITNHGYSNDAPVVFQGDGIAGGLSTSTTYYVRDATTNTFKVADAVGGTAKDLTGNSTGDLISIATTKCNAASTTDGYAKSLQDSLTAVTSPKQSSISDSIKTFTFTRTPTISSTAPYNVLQITYTVNPTSDVDNKIAEFYTEVIPNAAIQCKNP